MKEKFRLLSTGESTIFELDGKVMGKGVDSITFSHGKEGVKLSLDIDLNEFEFMERSFDEVEKEFKELAAE